MPQRIIKIILPDGRQAEEAQEVLESQENLIFWEEEKTNSGYIASILTDSGRSEELMDLFEKRFGSVNGFKLILMHVEASLPRMEEKKPDEDEAVQEPEPAQKTRLRISREELYSDIVDSTKLTRVFILMMILSTVVVAIGLLKNNVAVIIGAMVIAPLLGPNVALALSTNLGDRKLGTDATKTLAMGGAIVLILSIMMGYFFTVDPELPEISTRTFAGHGDMILALASGSAGVLAFTTGASAAVIGVMVAVALLPPLTVCGLLIGSGDFTLAAGAFLLFITNIICVNLAGILTFRFQGVSPRSWWEAKKARKAELRTIIIWVVLLAVLAGAIYLWST